MSPIITVEAACAPVVLSRPGGMSSQGVFKPPSREGNLGQGRQHGGLGGSNDVRDCRDQSFEASYAEAGVDRGGIGGEGVVPGESLFVVVAGESCGSDGPLLGPGYEFIYFFLG